MTDVRETILVVAWFTKMVAAVHGGLRIGGGVVHEVGGGGVVHEVDSGVAVVVHEVGGNVRSALTKLRDVDAEKFDEIVLS